MMQPEQPPSEASQVTLKTVFTVCAGTLLVVASVAAILQALLVVALIGASVLLAVALDHPVKLLRLHGVSPRLAIAIVVSAAILLSTSIGFLLIPAAVAQGAQLIERAPALLASLKHTLVLSDLGKRIGLSDWLNGSEGHLVEVIRGAATPIFSALRTVLTFIGGTITVVFLTVFMLVFGGPLVQAALAELRPQQRTHYAVLLTKIYTSLGGYLGGLTFICSVNAGLTTTFLAINSVPFFLPLGIFSGLASLIPYAGSVVAAVSISLLSAVGGVWHGVASAIFFVVYGQLEGNIIAPLVFRRTVNVNPLVVLISVLFFGSVAGVAGAIAAVPAVATLQIILRETLRLRRETLNSPGVAVESVPP
jgi:predicted PurR-regulated permease PerM